MCLPHQFSPSLFNTWIIEVFTAIKVCRVQVTDEPSSCGICVITHTYMHKIHWCTPWHCQNVILWHCHYVMFWHCHHSTIVWTPFSMCIQVHTLGGAGGLLGTSYNWRSKEMGWQGLTSRSSGKKWHPPTINTADWFTNWFDCVCVRVCYVYLYCM